MRFFWILSGQKIKQFFIILIALVFTIGIVYAEKENIPVFSSQENYKAIYNVKTDKKQIALTFDISWGEKRPELILDALEDNGLKGNATFFLSSPWSEEHTDIVQRIVDDGYEIGNHGYKYVNYSELSNEEIKNQIQKSHAILTDLTGKEPKLIRTPNGDFDSRVLEIADSLGYTVVMWDTDSKDWLTPGVDEIVNTVVNNTHPGDIVLMHASDSAKQTAEALPLIISKLRKQGYEFVTVSQLVSGASVDSKEID